MSEVFGTLLALLISGIARLLCTDQERAFYSTRLVTVATYDVVYGVITGHNAAVVADFGSLANGGPPATILLALSFCYTERYAIWERLPYSQSYSYPRPYRNGL